MWKWSVNKDLDGREELKDYMDVLSMMRWYADCDGRHKDTVAFKNDDLKLYFPCPDFTDYLNVLDELVY